MFRADLNPATKSEALEALTLAKAHAPRAAMASSAELCAAEATIYFEEGKFGFCHEWAVESLRYSLGILHPEFQQVDTVRKVRK